MFEYFKGMCEKFKLLGNELSFNKFIDLSCLHFYRIVTHTFCNHTLQNNAEILLVPQKFLLIAWPKRCILLVPQPVLLVVDLRDAYCTVDVRLLDSKPRT